MSSEAREVEIRERGLTLLALGGVVLLSSAFFVGVHVGRGLEGLPPVARTSAPPGTPAVRETPLPATTPVSSRPAVPVLPTGLPPGFQGPPRPAAQGEGGSASVLREGFHLEVVGKGARPGAREQKQRLADLGYPAYVRDGKLYVGDFASETEAVAMIAQLKKKEGIEARLVP